MLYGDWLDRYQHIERLGHAAVEGLLDGDVVVQEKLDGANATVALAPDDRLVIASRNAVKSVGGNPPTGFRGLIEYVLTNDAAWRQFFSMIKGAAVARGEWLVRHTIAYDPANMAHLYLFDLQDERGSYIHPDIWMPVARELGVCRLVPEVWRGTNPDVAVLGALSVGASAFGPKREGVVVKRYGFVNKFGETTWGKVVSADFRQQNALMMGGSHRTDAPELRFVGEYVTPSLVLKTIAKIEDLHEGERASVRNMPEVLGRVWHDVTREELLDWVDKKKSRTIDFGALRKLVTDKTRALALDHFNGIDISFDKGEPPCETS